MAAGRPRCPPPRTPIGGVIIARKLFLGELIELCRIVAEHGNEPRFQNKDIIHLGVLLGNELQASPNHRAALAVTLGSKVDAALAKPSPAVEPEVVRYMFAAFQPDVAVKARRERKPADAGGQATLLTAGDPATEVRLTMLEEQNAKIVGMLEKLLKTADKSASPQA